MLRIVHDADTATPEVAPLDLDELCRLAARDMIAIALEAERRAYLDTHAELLDAAGHRLVVSNGQAPSAGGPDRRRHGAGERTPGR